MSLEAQEKLKNDATKIAKEEQVFRHNRYKPLIEVMRKTNRRMEKVDKNTELAAERNWKKNKHVRLDHKYFLQGKSAARKFPEGSMNITHEVGMAMGKIMDMLKSRRETL